MADIQITGANRSGGSHEHITHVGSDSATWPVADVISWIGNKQATFYTLVGGKRADVGVVTGPAGKYLRTHADGFWNDNLLALPRCKVAAA